MLYRPGKCIGMIHSDTINILKVMDVDMVRTSAPCAYVYIYIENVLHFVTFACVQ